MMRTAPEAESDISKIDPELPRFDYRGSVCNCNYFAARVLGLTPEGVNGRSFAGISTPLQPDGRQSELAIEERLAAARAGLPQSFLWDFRYGAGTVGCLLEIRHNPDDDSFLCTFRRAGDGRGTEQFFVDNRSHLQEVLDFANCSLYVRDRAGRFLFANSAFLSTVGLAESEVIGRLPAEVLDGEAAEVLDRGDREVARDGCTLQCEETLRIADGSERTFLAIKYPIFSRSSGLHGMTSIAVDITERKRTETALRNVALDITSVSGENVLQELARLLAASLDVKFAYVGELRGDRHAVRTLATCLRGRSIESFDYDLQGTPCEKVMGREFHYVQQGILELYPGDNMLRQMGFESYAGYPLFDSQDRPIGIIAALHDRAMPERELVETLLKIFSVRAAAEIERLNSERILKGSEEQYRTVFHTASDGMALWTPGETLIDANAAFASMLGYSEQELREIRPRALVAPASETDYLAFNEAARAGRAHSCQLEMLRSDGSPFVADLRGVAIEYQGRPHYLTVGRDVTEQRRREIALQHNEARLRSTVDNALDCIVCMNADGTIAEFNPMAEQCFGYSRDEALGRSLAELIIPERYREAHCGGLERFLRERSSKHIGRRLRMHAIRRDGSEFPVELAVSLAPQEEGELFIGFLRDLSEELRQETEREKLESQLRQAQKMQAIGHLAGGIAHDFNNLLTGLLGYGAMARERLEAIDEQKALTYLQKSERSALRARDLIQQLLTFSRGQKGEPRVLDLGAVLREFMPLLESSLPSSVLFRTRVSADLAPVLLDPVQVEQVLMNLCINARDAMGGSGEIDIELGMRQQHDSVCASCRQPAQGSHVELVVRDSGPGIEAEVLERMFEPFYSTKSVGKGSGMGLSIVHGIVHENGGHVLVSNREGGGAEFRLLFPPQASAVEDREKRRGAVARQAGALSGNILLVDDDRGVLEFMSDLLGNWGLSVRAFNDPREAKSALQNAVLDFDLVILDQVMRIAGTELAAWLHERDPRLYIVLYSGYTGELSQVEIEACGISKVLSKPLDVAALRALLEARLSVR